MTEIFNKIFEILHVDYSLTVIAITYLLIKNVKFIKTASSKSRTIVNFIVAVIVGVVYYYVDSEEYSITNLLFSASISVMFYEWFLKHLFDKLGLHYEPSKEAKEKIEKA